jgi:hypothetical protein
MPYAMRTENRVEKFIPRPMVSWLMDGTDLQRGASGAYTLDLCRQIAPPLIQSTWPSPWRARTLIFAAGKEVSFRQEIILMMLSNLEILGERETQRRLQSRIRR